MILSQAIAPKTEEIRERIYKTEYLAGRLTKTLKLKFYHEKSHGWF
jgi:hypothetical protein